MDEQGVQQFRAEVTARKNLPTIPVVLARILQLVDADKANGKELIAVIEHDQALTAKILRLANSAFFGQSRRVAAIPRAVVLLGFTTVRNLALGVKVWDVLGAGIARSRVDELWAHAVAVGLATRSLATRLRIGDPEEGFTAGLLHDVGRLVLAMRFRDEYWRIVGGAGEVQPIHELEAATFGVDHAEVAGWMLEAWSLPPMIVDAVRLHHAPATADGIAGLLAVTDRLVAWTDLGNGTTRPEADALLATTEGQGISPDVWREVVVRLREGGELATLNRRA
jgi:HD-like signal output (HDOD) protein